MSAGKELAAARWAKAPASDRERLRTLRSKVTACRKCGVECCSARVARVHCVVRICPECFMAFRATDEHVCKKV